MTSKTEASKLGTGILDERPVDRLHYFLREISNDCEIFISGISIWVSSAKPFYGENCTI